MKRSCVHILRLHSELCCARVHTHVCACLHSTVNYACTRVHAHVFTGALMYTGQSLTMGVVLQLLSTCFFFETGSLMS